ncbi:IS30 family transposase, partial [Amorphus orientalis]|uniref:IS30 family transposase n=1 Tax=Amorphus orientalis TaxID=649198 RepID=UPI0027D864B4
MGTQYRHLDLEERCAIASLVAEGRSIRQIAAALDRSTSTIARELRRNAPKRDGYRAAYADELAWARRWRGPRMARQPALLHHVLSHLAMGWSPEQIAGRLALDKADMRISHESIYRFVYDQIRRTNDYRWRHYLPRAKSRRGRRRRPHRPMEHIKHRVSVTQRPASATTRRQAGHWEADLLHPRKSGAAVLVALERTSRLILLAKQPGKQAQPVADRFKAWFRIIPQPLRLSLTQDNGPEFFLHHQLHEMGVKTYFCDPHSPWQKGGVENMNGRLRRTIPLGTDPDSFSDDDLQALAARLNTTPRKCLGYRTPAEVFLKRLLHFKCEST